MPVRPLTAVTESLVQALSSLLVLLGLAFNLLSWVTAQGGPAPLGAVIFGCTLLIAGIMLGLGHSILKALRK